MVRQQIDKRIKELQGILNVRGEGILLLSLDNGDFRSPDGQTYKPDDLPILGQKYEMILIWDFPLDYEEH